MKEKDYADAFEGLDNAFGSKFELDVPMTEPERKTEVHAYVKSEDDEDLIDADYISTELKMAVESISNVMDKLNEDLKIGAPPRMFEVYAKLADSKINALDKLTNKSKAQLDAKVKLKTKDSPTKVQNNLVLTSKSLLQMLQQETAKTNTNVNFDDE